ncbi:MAG: HAMP domain-containing histidine kinase [Peptostreptococcaceae bacterium]|jgi:signal transduction histidine kinase|nr:HAMP domain-containing histidine kinase [Peptostreptococcaceae bacterium]
MKSIKSKLFFIFLIIIFLNTMIIFMGNRFYLKDYYIERKKEDLKNIVLDINENKDDVNINDKYINFDGNIVLIGNEKIYNIVSNYSFTGMRMNKNMGVNHKNTSNSYNLNEFENLNENEYVFLYSTKTKFNIEFLTLYYKLKNYKCIIEIPLENMDKSIDISSDFILINSIIALFISLLIAIGFSLKISKPIIQISKITGNISNLDFSEKLKVDGEDEISVLAMSINKMSYSLENFIKNLKKDLNKRKELDELRKTFVSNVSHELKTPLTIIGGYVQALKDKDVEKIKKENYINIVEEEVKNMTNMVEELLLLSKFEDIDFKIKRDKFDLSELIDQILEKYNIIFKNENINVKLIKDDIVEVNANKNDIKHVIRNYLDNAINHLDDNKYLKIELKKVDNYYKFSVFNSGKFIENQNSRFIWDNFYKIDESRTKKGSGSGLGLSIVKKILQLHGFDFGFENISLDIKGVEFYFFIN